MKIVKPVKVPVLTRVVELNRRPILHVTAILASPFSNPRGLLDEFSFWKLAAEALGASGVVDEGAAKARGEVLVAGSCFAPNGVPTKATYVRVQIGGVDKRLAVLGDRVWRGDVPTDPRPFTAMPVDWAHAFGGEGAANPYGKGIAAVGGEVPLPNVERYGALMRSPKERPNPVGLGPMDVTFQARRAMAGTFDKAWLEKHFPGVPPDCDPGFFNVAPKDQWIAGYFAGDEPFVVENMHPTEARLEGRLPGLRPAVHVTLRPPGTTASGGERFVKIPLQCDTVFLFPAVRMAATIFHGVLAITEDDADDVVHLVVGCELPDEPRPAEHYRRALEQRLERGNLANLSDADLMPPESSGVAPNPGPFDVGQWLRGENLVLKNARRGRERNFARERERLAAEGIDPDSLEQPPPEPELPPEDAEALRRYLEEQKALLDRYMEAGKEIRAKAEAQARVEFREMGLDYDAEMAAAARKAAGPPRFTAQGVIEEMTRAVADARAEGVPLDDLERQASDPAYRAMLERQEGAVREMYRTMAHFQPAAYPMDADGSARVRVLVGLARASQEPLSRRDLTGADLSGLDLSGFDLSGSFLEGANLEGARLEGANLEGAVLARANLTGASLVRANLTGANLGDARLEGARFDDAALRGAILARSEMAGARFDRADLSGADWFEARPAGARFDGARIEKAAFLKLDLAGARFDGADVSGATFIECELAGASFAGAIMKKTSFVTCKGRGASFRDAQLVEGVIAHGSDFSEADFRDATLTRTNLRGTALERARFDRTDMAWSDLSSCDAAGGSFERAILSQATMIRTRLAGASLRGANLMDALLSKARIGGADFTGANLCRADLSRTVGDAGTRFTDALVENVRTLPKAEVP